jgi:hypothetical protein
MESIWSGPFVGSRLHVYENHLSDRGTITGAEFSEGVVTFTTSTGKYSFHHAFPRGIKVLRNGDWKLLGDFGRWAYVKNPLLQLQGGDPRCPESVKLSSKA